MGFWKDFNKDPSDPYYRALASGLRDFGLAFGSSVGTEGFAALGPATAYGVQSHADTYERETERRRKEEEERQERARQAESREREDTRWDHYMEQWSTAKTEGARKSAEQAAGKEAEQERRESMLAAIGETGGTEARRRAALLSPAKLEAEYVKATGEPAAATAPTTRSFPDGSLRQWNGAEWEVLQEKPAGAGGETPAERRAAVRFGQSQEDRGRAEKSRTRAAAEAEAKGEVGPWETYRDARVAELRKLHPSVDWDDRSEVSIRMPGIRKMYDQKVREATERRAGGSAPAAAPATPAAGQARPAPASAGQGSGVPEGMTFDQAMAAMRERIGNKPDALQAVAQIEAAAQVVPPRVRDSRQFLEQLRADLLAGKSPQQIAAQIRQAFGGGG